MELLDLLTEVSRYVASSGLSNNDTIETLLDNMAKDAEDEM